MITLQHEGYDKVLNVPDSLNDITPEVLTKLAANVTLPKYKALIALCWKLNFADILFAKKDNNKSALVIPLCAKVNIGDDVKEDYEWLEIGKKVILTRSAIEMGVHVHIPNSVSMQNISKWAEGATAVVNPKSKGISINVLPNGQFMLIEFKVVSITDINGVIESDVLPEDPFNK